MSPSKIPRYLRKSIDSLENDYLRLILRYDTDSILDSMIEKVPQVKKLQLERDKIQEEVIELANCHFESQAYLTHERHELRKIVDEVDEIRKSSRPKYLRLVQLIFKKYDELAKKYSDESEQVARKFLAKELDYCDFIEQYKELRMKASKNTILSDKIREASQSTVKNDLN